MSYGFAEVTTCNAIIYHSIMQKINMVVIFRATNNMREQYSIHWSRKIISEELGEIRFGKASEGEWSDFF